MPPTEEQVAAAEAQIVEQSKRIEFFLTEYSVEFLATKMIATCHRKSTGGSYPSVYGRMDWDVPAPTMTTQCFGFGNGRFGHPEQDRAISLREAAILQTFPPSYRFLPKGTRVRFAVLGRLIGNAVPVRLGEVIAESLLRHSDWAAR